MRNLRKQARPPRPRNWLAVLAHRRQAGAMKDRREGRGGACSWRALAEGDGALPCERSEGCLADRRGGADQGPRPARP